MSRTTPGWASVHLFPNQSHFSDYFLLQQNLEKCLFTLIYRHSRQQSPSKQGRTPNQQVNSPLLSIMTTSISGSSQFSLCFLISEHLALLRGGLLVSGCLLPVTSNILICHSYILAFHKDFAATVRVPKFFSWSRNKSRSLFRLFFFCFTLQGTSELGKALGL